MRRGRLDSFRYIFMTRSASVNIVWQPIELFPIQKQPASRKLKCGWRPSQGKAMITLIEEVNLGQASLASHPMICLVWSGSYRKPYICWLIHRSSKAPSFPLSSLPLSKAGLPHPALKYSDTNKDLAGRNNRLFSAGMLPGTVLQPSEGYIPEKRSGPDKACRSVGGEWL